MENETALEVTGQTVSPAELAPDTGILTEAVSGSGVSELGNSAPKAESAPAKARSQKEITEDYQRTCFQAGEMQYHVKIMSEALLQMNERIRTLNNEASVLQTAENAKIAADKANQAKQAAENLRKAEEKRARKAAGGDLGASA